MAKQYMNIGGRVFDVKKSSTWIPSCKGQLRDCYNRPSDTKKSIMQSWWDWANTIPGTVTMWVHSYNCNFFTIGGEMRDIENRHYAFLITRTRQEIWRVIE